MEDRMISMEEKIAFLEKTVADLDEVVREFGRRLEHLSEAVVAVQRDAKRDADVTEDA